MNPGEKIKYGLMQSAFTGQMSPAIGEGFADLGVMAAKTTVKYVAIGGGIVIGVSTLGTVPVIYIAIIGAGVDATMQIDRSLESFGTSGEITYYDPARGIDSALIGASLGGPLSKAPPALIYSLQGVGGAHSAYQIYEGNYVSGTAEALLVIAPLSNPQFRAELLETMGLGATRPLTVEQEAYLLNSITETALRNTRIVELVRRNSRGQAIGENGRFVSDPFRVSIPEVSRPYLRRATIEEILARAPRDHEGRLLDPNTFEVIHDMYHIGHKPGYEWWRIRDRSILEGWSREQLIEFVNNPDLYQIELPANNLSHRFELPR